MFDSMEKLFPNPEVRRQMSGYVGSMLEKMSKGPLGMILQAVITAIGTGGGIFGKFGAKKEAKLAAAAEAERDIERQETKDIVFGKPVLDANGKVTGLQISHEDAVKINNNMVREDNHLQNALGAKDAVPADAKGRGGKPAVEGLSAEQIKAVETAVKDAGKPNGAAQTIADPEVIRAAQKMLDDKKAKDLAETYKSYEASLTANGLQVENISSSIIAQNLLSGLKVTVNADGSSVIKITEADMKLVEAIAAHGSKLGLDTPEKVVTAMAGQLGPSGIGNNLTEILTAFGLKPLGNSGTKTTPAIIGEIRNPDLLIAITNTVEGLKEDAKNATLAAFTPEAVTDKDKKANVVGGQAVILTESEYKSLMAKAAATNTTPEALLQQVLGQIKDIEKLLKDLGSHFSQPGNQEAHITPASKKLLSTNPDAKIDLSKKITLH
jgi:hypothetical protein